MPRVAIIPGHGGFDPGAVNSRTGAVEAYGALAVAIKLGVMLEAAGIEYQLSRYTDEACWGTTTVGQDVTNQTRFANQQVNGDYFFDIALAIHFNSFHDPEAHGVEVLFTNYPTLDVKELLLAQLLLDELVAATGMRNRGLKETPSGVSVIKYTKIPCVLSENGFISNGQESAWCTEESRQDVLAKAHFTAVCRYFDIPFESSNIERGGEQLMPEIIKIKVADKEVDATIINGHTFVDFKQYIAAVQPSIRWDAEQQKPVIELGK